MSEKVDRSIEEKALRYRIDRREVAEEALGREAESREKEEILKRLKRAGEILDKIPAGEIVRIVRESREER